MIIKLIARMQCLKVLVLTFLFRFRHTYTSITTNTILDLSHYTALMCRLFSSWNMSCKCCLPLKLENNLSAPVTTFWLFSLHCKDLPRCSSLSPRVQQRCAVLVFPPPAFSFCVSGQMANPKTFRGTTPPTVSVKAT